ncbi:MAG: DNA repair protein RecN [Gammaproteobacteria bacterium]|nr:DNA repair protein RecN [Gammaproteobacteria bacterium]
MLSHIHIRDFAIVDELDLELAAGMTALTGETGAGKSILVDALGLILGGRADMDAIRHGCDKAELTATFNLSALPQVRAWLREHDLDSDDDCQLRRIVGREGRSRAYINGRPAPVQQLQELGDQLADIHGQHEHQSLLKREVQRELLDAYAGHETEVVSLGDIYRDYNARRDELERLRGAAQDRGARGELLRFHIQELETLDLAEHELTQLEDEHRRLANAGRLLESCQRAVAALYEDEVSASTLLGHAHADLGELTRFDPKLQAICDLLDGALIQTREASDELRDYTEGLDLDPARLDWIDQRLATIQHLARKHRVKPEELTALLERSRAELAQLDHADEHFDALEKDIAALNRSYVELALRIRARRHQAALELGQKISAAMHELGMPGGRFEIGVDDLPGDELARHGLDRIEFRVSANPGQPPQPLTKVASGGELSRISLAIQVIATHASRIPTLVFDEVDTGIGGGVAEVVGQQLRALGENRQVLCVTHLPQVAAQAHRHCQVQKLTGTETTRTRIRQLSESERVDEIARMLGGLEVTASTRAHAEEMIQRAQSDTAGTKKRGGRKKA